MTHRKGCSELHFAAGADPACGALGPGECMARTSKCKLVKELVKGKSGHVRPVLDCATTLGIPKMQVVGKIGEFRVILFHLVVRPHALEGEFSVGMIVCVVCCRAGLCGGQAGNHRGPHHQRQ